MLLQTLPAQFAQLQTVLGALAQLIPPGQFYRYSDIFSRAMQTASFMVVLAAFLKHEQVSTKQEVENVLGSECFAASFFDHEHSANGMI